MSTTNIREIAGQRYIAGPEGQKVWVVKKCWPAGKVEHVAAYFSESLARVHAGYLVGKDGALIGLEMINVLDVPQ